MMHYGWPIDPTVQSKLMSYAEAHDLLWGPTMAVTSDDEDSDDRLDEQLRNAHEARGWAVE